ALERGDLVTAGPRTPVAVGGVAPRAPAPTTPTTAGAAALAYVAVRVPTVDLIGGLLGLPRGGAVLTVAVRLLRGPALAVPAAGAGPPPSASSTPASTATRCTLAAVAVAVGVGAVLVALGRVVVLGVVVRTLGGDDVRRLVPLVRCDLVRCDLARGVSGLLVLVGLVRAGRPGGRLCATARPARLRRLEQQCGRGQ